MFWIHLSKGDHMLCLFFRIPYLWNVVWTQLVINNQALPKCLSTSRSNVCPYVLNNIRPPLRLYFKEVASVIGSSILTSALHSSIFNAHMCTAPPRPRAFRPPPVFFAEHKHGLSMSVRGQSIQSSFISADTRDTRWQLLWLSISLL